MEICGHIGQFRNECLENKDVKKTKPYFVPQQNVFEVNKDVQVQRSEASS